MGPTQKSRDAVRKPRTNLFEPSSSSRENLRSRNSPIRCSPSSIRHHSPSRVPISSAPKTINGFSVSRNICSPIAPVNNPMPAITVSFSLSGMRAPKSKPMVPPTMTVAILRSVPIIKNPNQPQRHRVTEILISPRLRVSVAKHFVIPSPGLSYVPLLDFPVIPGQNTRKKDG